MRLFGPTRIKLSSKACSANRAQLGVQDGQIGGEYEAIMTKRALGSPGLASPCRPQKTDLAGIFETWRGTRLRD